MSLCYITFGVKYATEPHPLLSWAHPDGWLTVEADTYEHARAIAFAITGGKHAFDYRDEPNQDIYPLGEIHRVSVATVPAEVSA